MSDKAVAAWAAFAKAGCGRTISYVIAGETFYAVCVGHDHAGHCQGTLTDWTVTPV